MGLHLTSKRSGFIKFLKIEFLEVAFSVRRTKWTLQNPSPAKLLKEILIYPHFSIHNLEHLRKV